MANNTNKITLSLDIRQTRANIIRDLKQIMPTIPPQKIKVRLDIDAARKQIVKDLKSVTSGVKVGNGSPLSAWDASINKTKSELKSLQKQAEEIFAYKFAAISSNSAKKWMISGSREMEKYKADVNRVREAMDNLRNVWAIDDDGIIITRTKLQRDLVKELVSAYKDLVISQKQATIAGQNAAAEAKISRAPETLKASWTKLLDTVSQYEQQVRNTASRDPAAYARLTTLLDNVEKRRGTVLRLANDFRQLKADFRAAGLEGETLGQRFKRLLSDNIGGLIRGAVTGLFTRAFREMYNNVKDLDSELTQFQIVTRKSDAEITKFGNDANKVAKQIATSTKEVINAATVYARLGYSDTDALDLSKYTAMYAKVAGVEIGAAEENITATIKAFDIDAASIESLLDKMTKVGRHNCPSMW